MWKAVSCSHLHLNSDAIMYVSMHTGMSTGGTEKCVLASFLNHCVLIVVFCQLRVCCSLWPFSAPTGTRKLIRRASLRHISTACDIAYAALCLYVHMLYSKFALTMLYIRTTVKCLQTTVFTGTTEKICLLNKWLGYTKGLAITFAVPSM